MDTFARIASELFKIDELATKAWKQGRLNSRPLFHRHADCQRRALQRVKECRGQAFPGFERRLADWPAVRNHYATTYPKQLKRLVPIDPAPGDSPYIWAESDAYLCKFLAKLARERPPRKAPTPVASATAVPPPVETPTPLNHEDFIRLSVKDYAHPSVYTKESKVTVARRLVDKSLPGIKVGERKGKKDTRPWIMAWDKKRGQLADKVTLARLYAGGSSFVK